MSPNKPEETMEEVNTKIDLILGLAPVGTLKGDRNQQVKNLFATEITLAVQQERERLLGRIVWPKGTTNEHFEAITATKSAVIKAFKE